LESIRRSPTTFILRSLNSVRKWICDLRRWEMVESLSLFVVLCKNWIQNGFSTFFLFFDQNMQDVFLCIHAYCTKGCYLELSQLCHWTDPLVQEIYDVEEEKISKICCSKQYPLSSLQLKGSRSLCWHKKRKNINLKIHFLIAKRPVPAEWTAVKFCWSHRSSTSIAAGKCLLNFSSALIAVLHQFHQGPFPCWGQTKKRWMTSRVVLLMYRTDQPSWYRDLMLRAIMCPKSFWT